MKLDYCSRCNVYLPSNMLIYVWNDRKEKNERLCKECCIDLAVDAEYINMFDDNGKVIE